MLLEVSVASALLVLFASGALLFASSSRKAYRTESLSSELDSSARSALATIGVRLRTASSGNLTPVGTQAPFNSNWVSFRRGTGYAVGMPQWGDPELITFEYDPGDPDDGVDNDGDGLIDEGRVVWIENQGAPNELRKVLCNWVAEDLEGEIPGNNLDDNENGLVDEPGLSFDFEARRATVRMTLARRDALGVLIEHTVERTFALRNTPKTP